MECKKYTIIESYPSIIKHEIFIIALPMFLVYTCFFIFEIFENIYLVGKKSFKNIFIYLKELFIPKKEIYIEGPSSFIDFDINTKSFQKASQSKLNSLKDYIIDSKIKNFLGKESKRELKRIIEENDFTIENFEYFMKSSTNFVLREETIFFREEASELIDNNFVFLTKGYNKPAIKTYNLFKKFIK